jgi:hypothetical protein
VSKGHGAEGMEHGVQSMVQRPGAKGMEHGAEGMGAEAQSSKLEGGALINSTAHQL